MKPSEIDFQELPSVDIGDTNTLPETAGIYFVIDDGEVLYIGKAVNLLNRWMQHHKHKEIRRKHPNAKVCYNGVTYQTSFIQAFDELITKERDYIQYFKPKFNVSKGIKNKPPIKVYRSLGTYIPDEDRLPFEEIQLYFPEKSLSQIVCLAVRRLLIQQEESNERLGSD